MYRLLRSFFGPWVRVRVLAGVLVLVITSSVPSSRGDDYAYGAGSGPFEAKVWNDLTTGAMKVGPPGAGDNASVTGTITATSGSVLNLYTGGDFIVSGTFAVGDTLTTEASLEVDGKCQTNIYFQDGDTSVLTGTGTLTADKVTAVSTQITGGNLVANDFTGDYAILDGGSLTAATFGGRLIMASSKAAVKLPAGASGVQVTLASGAKATLASLTNNVQGTDIEDSGTQLTVTKDYSTKGGSLKYVNSTLDVGGNLTLDGFKEAGGSTLSGGGNFNHTAVSVGGVFAIGNATKPGASIGVGAGSQVTAHTLQLGVSAGVAGNLTLQDAGTTLEIDGPALEIGKSGTGDLVMETGAQLIFGPSLADLDAGLQSGGSGALSADGAGTLVDARTARVSLGQSAGGSGAIELSNGAALLLGMDTYIGDGGQGGVSITTGASAQVLGTATAFQIGRQAGSNGVVVVSAPHGLTLAGQLMIGVQGKGQLSIYSAGNSVTAADDVLVGGDDYGESSTGNGTLYVASGGAFHATNDTETEAIIAPNPGSTGELLVQGKGSQATFATPVLFGEQGYALAGVTLGGTLNVSADTALIGGEATGSVRVDVFDPGSTAVFKNLVVGALHSASSGSYSATLAVNNRGILRASETLAFTNTAAVYVSSFPPADPFAARFTLPVTPADVTHAGGQIFVGTDNSGPDGTIRVGTNGVFGGQIKTLAGNVAVGAHGTFKPGNGPGTFSITGNCDLNDGGAGGGETDLKVVGATTPGTDYDQLIVSGTVTLGGTLKVALTSYGPKVGDRFRVITAGSLSGKFSEIISAGVTLEPVIDANSLTLEVKDVTDPGMIVLPPVITSASSAAGTVGEPFSYQIVAKNGPTSFSATPLPAGLIINTQKGIISGTPEVFGEFVVNLAAINDSGPGVAPLDLTISPAPLAGSPVIDSDTNVVTAAGSSFRYQITATNSPTSFAAAGLPAGLTINASSGVISGTPTAGGTYDVILSATNAVAVGTATLDLMVTGGEPTVTILPAGSGMVEEGGGKAKVIVRRTGGTGEALTVHYKVKGSAKAGVDYKVLPGMVTIPAGESQVKIKLRPINNATVDGTRVAKFKLVPSTGDGYLVGTPATAKVRILDND